MREKLFNLYENIIKPILNNQVATGLSLTAVTGFVLYRLKEIPNILIFFL